VATAARIRGLGVVIPAPIAWKTAAALMQHGTIKRGYLGIAGQPARLAAAQQAVAGRAGALLVVGVTDGSPAAGAGITVGDVIIDFDGQPVESPEDLLELLAGDGVGRSVSLKMLRGGQLTDIVVTKIGERPAS
jgi:S1-C subfamily serine protease